MGLKDFIRDYFFDDPQQKRETENPVTVGYLISDELGCIGSKGYRKLADCPEVQTAVNTIAGFVSDMTIHLMKNTDKGDVRVKNELSRKVDINPYQNMTRKNLIYWLTKVMLLEGNALLYPKFSRDGLLEDLRPITKTGLQFAPHKDSYVIKIHGERVYKPDEVLHFVFNPHMTKPWKGQGFTVELRDVLQTLKQTASTRVAFLSSEFKPSLVVGVSALSGELQTSEGRTELAEKFGMETSQGKPWIVPEGLMKVEQIKPLSLNDLAINDSVVLDKKAVAGLFGVPPYYLGIGDFNEDEVNYFIKTRVMSIANIIQQTLTKGLLYSDDWYFRFNPRSLYAYSIDTLSKVGGEMYVRGTLTGNEWRDWIGLPPMDGLDDLVILENYIPLGSIGDQKKLKDKEELQ